MEFLSYDSFMLRHGALEVPLDFTDICRRKGQLHTQWHTVILTQVGFIRIVRQLKAVTLFSF
jgi:hypothetical protein